MTVRFPSTTHNPLFPSAFVRVMSASKPHSLPATPAPAPEQTGGFWSIPRILLVYVLLTTAINTFQRKSTDNISHNTAETHDSDGGNSATEIQHESPSKFQQTFLNIDPAAKLPVFPTKNSKGKRLGAHRNLFKSNNTFDMHLYITHDFYFDLERHGNQSVWKLEHIPYNWTFSGSPQLTWNFTVTQEMLAGFRLPDQASLENSDSASISTEDEGVVLGDGRERPDRTSPSLDPSRQRSVYAHVFLTKTNYSIDSSSSAYDSDSIAYERFNLIRHRKRKVEKKTYKLLGSSESSDEADDVHEARGKGEGSAPEAAAAAEEQPLVPFFCPTLDIAVVMDLPPFERNNIPAVTLPLMNFNDLGAYYPVVYNNDFFLSSKNLIEINETMLNKHLELKISYAHLSFMRWHMQTQMEQQWKAQANMGTSSERDTDVIREVLFDTNPILLGVTFAVSLLHSLFDFLAFKNDIQFWRKKKNMGGMSVKSLVVNCFFQTVIFLYLLDNDTSWMILMSSGVGLLIEYWKLGKAFNVKVSRTQEEVVLPLMEEPVKGEGTGSGDEDRPSDSSPRLARSDETARDQKEPPVEGVESVTMLSPSSSKPTETSVMGVSVSYKLADGYANSKTREYDAIATTHLLYLVVPLVCGYSAYSLLHIAHKSFYSWFLGSLVGFVYAFGFVLMTPQLFINYKLQSVAHMPWKAMVYKSLNTFIDDLFAFVIKMPVMHRIACFRDDFIFFIYLYQKWAYRVDHSRTNEFGQGGEEESGKRESSCDVGETSVTGH